MPRKPAVPKPPPLAYQHLVISGFVTNGFSVIGPFNGAVPPEYGHLSKAQITRPKPTKLADPSGSYVLAEGSLRSGFVFYGPFASAETAMSYQTRQGWPVRTLFHMIPPPDGKGPWPVEVRNMEHA